MEFTLELLKEKAPDLLAKIQKDAASAAKLAAETEFSTERTGLTEQISGLVGRVNTAEENILKFDKIETIRQENEALRQQLKALEQRMQSVAGQVLEYADADVAPPGEQLPQQKTKPETEALSEKADESEEGLSASVMFAAIVLVLLFVFYIIYSTGHKHRRRS